jgi:hypothetical protein
VARFTMAQRLRNNFVFVDPTFSAFFLFSFFHVFSWA